MAEQYPSEPGGRLDVQRSIINSETFWYGELQDSGKIHEQLHRNPMGPGSDPDHTTGSRSMVYEQHEDGTWDVTFSE